MSTPTTSTTIPTATTAESKAGGGAKPRVGVLGSGDVGKYLAAGLAKRGYEVTLASRDPAAEKLVKWQTAQAAGVKLANFEDTARFGQLLILATLWGGTESALTLAKKENFVGKTVIDATNPLKFEGGGLELAIGHTDSGGEQVQRWLVGAHVVKAFNIIGQAHMIDPNFNGQIPDMFIAGDDAKAKLDATAILTNLGWSAGHVLDAGGMREARLLEPMCVLWIRWGFKSNSWNHAFALLRK